MKLDLIYLYDVIFVNIFSVSFVFLESSDLVRELFRQNT